MKPHSRKPSIRATEVPRRAHPLRWIAVALVLGAAAIAFSLWVPPYLPRSITAAVEADAPAGTDPAPAGDVETPLSVERIRRAYTASVPLAQRLSFFPPFTSYASVDEISRIFDTAGTAFERRKRHATLPERLPPNDLDTLFVAGYRHLGVTGQLELQFFNDRLYQIEFEPDDPVAYRPRFRARWSNLKREQSGRSERVQGSLRIASSLDLATSEVGRALQTRPFVLWQDLRLIRQRDDWNIQFAREAVQ